MIRPALLLVALVTTGCAPLVVGVLAGTGALGGGSGGSSAPTTAPPARLSVSLSPVDGPTDEESEVVAAVTGGDLTGATVLVDGARAGGVRLLGLEEVRFVVPRAATNRSGDRAVEVRTPAGASGRARFAQRAVAPTIFSSSVDAGPTEGGTTVVVSGDGFVDGLRVTVGGVDAPVDVAGANLLSFTTPSAAAGPVMVPVTLVHPDGPRADLPRPFRYVAPTRLAFTTQPEDGSEGAALAPVRVSLLDAAGDVIAAPRDVTLALAGGGTLSGTLTARASAGVATFTDLSLPVTATGLRLEATSPGLTSATSEAFDVEPPPDDHGDAAATATAITLGTPRAGRIERAGDVDVFAVALDAFTPYVLTTQTLSLDMDTVLRVVDRDGTTVLTTNDDVSPGSRTSRVVFAPPAAGTYYLRVTHKSAAGLGTYEVLGVVRPPPPNAPEAPENLRLTRLRPRRVDLRWDSVSFEDSFRVERRTRSGTFAEVGAVAANQVTFVDSTVDPETAYEYRVVARNGTGDSPPSDVLPVTTPPERPHLRFEFPPPRTPADRPIDSLVVYRYDAQGEVVVSPPGVVSVALTPHPTGAVLSGTTDDTTDLVSGQAYFFGLSIDRIARGVTLVATASGYESGTSLPFDIGAGRMVFTRSPVDTTSRGLLTFEVQTQDRYGTLDTAFDGLLELSVASGPNAHGLTYLAIQVDAVGGVATYDAADEVFLDVVGRYVLRASGGGVTGLSDAFDVLPRPDPPRVTAFTANPSPATTGEVVRLDWSVDAPATLTLTPGGDVTGTTSADVTPFPVASPAQAAPYALRATTATVTSEIPGLAWVAAAGGPRSDEVGDVVTRPDGVVFVTGRFNESATFGAGTPNETTLSGTIYDMYLARYEADGTFAWARRAGGPEQVGGKRLAITADGTGVIVVGSFAGDAVFGPGEPNQTTLSCDRFTPHAFVARFDAATGALLWAKECGRHGAGVGVLAGDVVVTGGFNNSYTNSFTFGEGEPGAVTLVASDGDGFLARLSGSTGELVWVIRLGGGGSDAATCLAVIDDEVVVAVRTESPTFQPSPPGSPLFTDPASEVEFVLARFRANATCVWARRAVAVAQGWLELTELVATLDGDLYATGGLGSTTLSIGTATFAPATPNATSLSSVRHFSDGFVARFGSDGALGWLRSQGNESEARSTGLAALPDGGVVVSGVFHDDLTLGEGEHNRTRLRSSMESGFLARYEPDGDLGWAHRLPEVDRAMVAPLSSGGVIVLATYSYLALVGVGEPGQRGLPSFGGSSDVFVARYDLLNHRFVVVPRR